MEYLIVRYIERRQVVVDGRLQGWTNEILELERGTHVVSLKRPPDDFVPFEMPLVLEDSGILSPLEVRFEQS
jgi:hypothetical protein